MYYLYVPTETLEIPATAERLLRSIGATGVGLTMMSYKIKRKQKRKGSV